MDFKPKRHVLSASCVPSTALGAGSRAVPEEAKPLCLRGFTLVHTNWGVSAGTCALMEIKQGSGVVGGKHDSGWGCRVNQHVKLELRLERSQPMPGIPGRGTVKSQGFEAGTSLPCSDEGGMA